MPGYYLRYLRLGRAHFLQHPNQLFSYNPTIHGFLVRATDSLLNKQQISINVVQITTHMREKL